jgi:hypothetical protein
VEGAEGCSERVIYDVSWIRDAFGREDTGKSEGNRIFFANSVKEGSFSFGGCLEEMSEGNVSFDSLFFQAQTSSMQGYL